MAKEVLEKAEWISKFSDSFQNDLVKLMMPFDAPEGHVFITEGDPIDSFLLVETGTLLRTKHQADGNGEPIKIDEIHPVRCTGFLHVAGNADPEVAFATITAGKGGAKVWVVPGGHFRKMCEGNPKHSSEVIEVSEYCHIATTLYII